MIKMIFTLLILFAFTESFNVRTFTPGLHQLTPEDYEYSKYIIVELWGGGSSGALCSGTGGASGAYIKAIIDTDGDAEFNITVGSGGDALRGNPNCCNSQITSNPGSQSRIWNSEISLAAGGGSIESCDRNQFGADTVIERYGIELDTIIIRKGRCAACGYCIFVDASTKDNAYNSPYSYLQSAAGASAPFGGSGSAWLYYYQGSVWCPTNIGANGETPGSGGRGGVSDCVPNKSNRCFDTGSGGDGRVIIYYSNSTDEFGSKPDSGSDRSIVAILACISGSALVIIVVLCIALIRAKQDREVNYMEMKS